MSSINFQKTYQLGDTYEGVKKRAYFKLAKYLDYPNLVTFNDVERSVSFSTERLIPAASTNRLRVMLLFSNPHPHSVYQGMFLSPNTRGRENPFWPVMNDAGWLTVQKENRNPERLLDICINATYQGPFELIFYCYYAFPTEHPDDIKKIFGEVYFSQFIERESYDEFSQTIQGTSVKAVVTFNKGIFNLIAKNHFDRYIDRLVDGELIQSQLRGFDRQIPIFLTFPTGWRFHKRYIELRKASLDSIKSAIYEG